MLNRAGVWFHTDLKDFEDVDFADYPHRLSTVLQGRVGMVRGRPQPEWNTCRVCEWPTMPVFCYNPAFEPLCLILNVSNASPFCTSTSMKRLLSDVVGETVIVNLFPSLFTVIQFDCIDSTLPSRVFSSLVT